MREPVTTALQHRDEHQPTADAIRLPAEAPPDPIELPPDDIEPRPTVEEITKNELRLMGEAKNAPAPDRVLETAPMLKPSLVAPVQLSGRMFHDFLDALASVADENASVPILRNVRMTYTEGELRLEATNHRVWAIAKMRAHGGSDGFECVLPLQRARNVVKRIAAQYPTISIGVDGENIHIGDYSFPHGGRIGDYPTRLIPMPEEIKAALPAHYLEGILTRLGGVVNREHDRLHLRGVLIDFNEGVAVASDRMRLHMLQLHELQIATRHQLRARPAVTLTLEFFEFLKAVVEREWVAMLVSDKMVTAAGEDFGALARPLEEPFGNWREAVPNYQGYWVVDKQALIDALKDAQPLQSGYIKLAVDSIGDQVIITARGSQGETYRRALTGYRRGGPPAVSCGVKPRFLLDAAQATEGGLVLLGFDESKPEDRPITVRGEEGDFLAVVMPHRMD
jgi:DNA polymerase III sliding clamp (beta) subunit (PCNA family)